MTRDIGMWNITARSAMIDGRGTTTAAPHTNHSLDHTTTITQADLLESTPSLLDARAGVVDGASATQRARQRERSRCSWAVHPSNARPSRNVLLHRPALVTLTSRCN